MARARSGWVARGVGGALRRATLWRREEDHAAGRGGAPWWPQMDPERGGLEKEEKK